MCGRLWVWRGCVCGVGEPYPLLDAQRGGAQVVLRSHPSPPRAPARHHRYASHTYDAKPPHSRDTGPTRLPEGLHLHCARVCVLCRAHANFASLGLCCGVLCWVWEQVGC
jgi:hypothetical protein